MRFAGGEPRELVVEVHGHRPSGGRLVVVMRVPLDERAVGRRPVISFADSDRDRLVRTCSVSQPLQMCTRTVLSRPSGSRPAAWLSSSISSRTFTAMSLARKASSADRPGEWRAFAGRLERPRDCGQRPRLPLHLERRGSGAGVVLVVARASVGGVQVAHLGCGRRHARPDCSNS